MAALRSPCSTSSVGAHRSARFASSEVAGIDARFRGRSWYVEFGAVATSARDVPVAARVKASEIQQGASEIDASSLLCAAARQSTRRLRQPASSCRTRPPVAPGPLSACSRAMASDHIGILGYDSLHFVVENLERSRKFYTEKFDFKEVARAGDELASRSGQQSVVFGAGDVRVCVSTPLGQNSKAARFLRRHPAGVMSLSFRVKNLDETIAFLEARGGTFLLGPGRGQGRARRHAIAPSRSRPRSATSPSASSSGATTAPSRRASSTRASAPTWTSASRTTSTASRSSTT